MQFDTLAETDIQTITQTFNKAFADYEIPFHFTPETLRQKIDAEDIDLSISVGAFDNGALVGFIFFGLDEVDDVITAWDGGTGVLPDYRGQQLTQKMFTSILPALQSKGVQRALLEVLENNVGAKKIYEKIGFETIRLLHAYKGAVTKTAHQHTVEILHNTNFDALSQLCDWQPAWQQMNRRVQNLGDAVETIGIKDGYGNIVAYAHYNKGTKRVYQFATASAHRRKGMATALFNHIAGDNVTPVSFINADADSANSHAFMEAIGLNLFISQYEMRMCI